MKESEAMRAVTMLFAYYAARDVTEDTAQLWARSIEPFELIDAQAAANDLAEHLAFMPSLAEYMGGINAARIARVSAETNELPEHSYEQPMSFGAFLQANADLADRVHDLVGDETFHRIVTALEDA